VKPTFSNEPTATSGAHPRAAQETSGLAVVPSPASLSTPPGGQTRPPFQPGHCLDRYRLDAIIGHGASSTVYRAMDTALSLPVVVKVLSPDASPALTERFKNEIQFSRRVSHAGFSRIFELHDEETFDGPLRYLTMELIDGRTLGDVMNEGPMTPTRAVAIARTLCDIVAAAHEQGVVHGDLKPGNVMVRHPDKRRALLERRSEARDELVVLDFGAAVSRDVSDTGGRVGSVRYMAPELFEHDRPSPQSDVWAIGVILYGCLTGGYPFDGKSEREIAEATRTPPPPPSTKRAGLPPVVDELCLTALTRDRARRFQDCRALATALDDASAALRPRQGLLRRLLNALRP